MAMDRKVFTRLSEAELAVLCKAETRDNSLDPVCLKALDLIAEFEGLEPMGALNMLIALRVIEEHPNRELIERLQLEY